MVNAGARLHIRFHLDCTPGMLGSLARNLFGELRYITEEIIPRIRSPW